jgi:DNA modification methylase
MKVQRVPIDAVHLDPANARVHGEENMSAILGSLTRFGQVEPLVIQQSTRRIIGGNGRIVAMKQLGWTEVEIVEVDVDDLTAVALGIALNRTSSLASWSEEALARLLAELQVQGSLDGTGYSDAEVKTLLAAANAAAREGLCDPDDVPLPPDAAVTQSGDLWILGDHRLLCGDSSSVADLDRLLAGARIQLVNTDPPYNVKVEPRSNNAIAAGLSSFQGTTHHQKLDVERHPEKSQPTTRKLRAKDRPLANDFVSDAEFDRLLLAWFGNIARVLEPGRGFYIWGGYANCGNYPPVLKACELYFSQSIIWDKQHPVLTRKDFMGAHEWAFYGWRLGAAHHWYGPNNATDLWAIKKINPQSMEHLTAKPAELAVRAMQYSSQAGENVLDLFGGSGSTMIAAEQTGRRAYLMEIDALYCDVICDRFQRFTGKPAVLERTGESPIPMKPREAAMR